MNQAFEIISRLVAQFKDHGSAYLAASYQFGLAARECNSLATKWNHAVRDMIAGFLLPSIPQKKRQM